MSVQIKRISKELTGRTRKSRIYFWAEKIQDLFRQKFDDEHVNPRLYRRLLPDIFKEIGLPETTRAKWRKDADRSAEAFILFDNIGYDVHVIIA